VREPRRACNITRAWPRIIGWFRTGREEHPALSVQSLLAGHGYPLRSVPPETPRHVRLGRERRTSVSGRYRQH
jgi:hypothetical protein